MLKMILGGIASILVVLLIVVALQPSTFRVQRSADIHSSDALVYDLIADFHQWEKWSPWEKMDPNMTKIFRGTPGALGSSYIWKGNDKVGKGQMTLVKVAPRSFIEIKLEFYEPWKATNKTEFKLTPKNNAVSLTWAMTGENNFIGKFFSLFMDMDKMIGKDFEKGLSSIKRIAEK